MLLGRTVLRLDLSRERSTTLAAPTPLADTVLELVGEATLEPPDEELLL